MKALKLFIGFILFSLASKGQTPTGPQPVKTWFEYQKFNVKTSFVPPRDTLSTADSGAIATKGNTVYVKNGKWRPVADTNAVIGSDTFYLTHIGTSASQINTIFAVHGGIRVSRWGDGLYMHVHFAADSLASYWADTNFLATHAWVIAQYGAGTGGSASDLEAVLAAGHTATANGIIVFDNNIATIGSFSGKQAILAATGEIIAQNAANWQAKLLSTLLTAHRSIEMPDVSATLVASINGVSPNNAGNVTLTDMPTSLPTFSNNAAAITGGLAAGKVYRNGDIIQIVH